MINVHAVLTTNVTERNDVLAFSPSRKNPECATRDTVYVAINRRPMQYGTAPDAAHSAATRMKNGSFSAQFLANRSVKNTISEPPKSGPKHNSTLRRIGFKKPLSSCGMAGFADMNRERAVSKWMKHTFEANTADAVQSVVA